ncbi:MAG: glycogen synthase, partial [Clostridiales bacterium]|nr:glycogen synthase [Clostridiales bacterium]
MMSVLMATAEFSPLVKSGGLGDVLGSLPQALKKEGVDARVIMPLYSFLPEDVVERMEFVKAIHVYLGWRKQYCGIYELDYGGLKMYFVDSLFYFGGNQLYYSIEDDIERFAFFCMSVLSALPHIDFAPDVIHCHDWHTSLIPVIYSAHFKRIQFYSRIRMVMTIHNLKYQGICNKYKLYDIIGLNDSYSAAPSLSSGYDLVNCLKGGLSLADKITTVSETYAREIRYQYYGEGLDWLLNWRGGDLVGILNGIDAESYDPATDAAIAHAYAADSAAEQKRRNKAALRERLGLSQADADRPMIAVVSRLVAQKGMDLVERVFDELVGGSCGAQFVLLGTGDGGYESFFREKALQRPGDVSASICFDEATARMIYAASDFFLMPSLFEPCGISQMIAMRYGSLPIVRETGGLRDTVFPYDPQTGQGCGYTFATYNAHDMLDAVSRALAVYRESPEIHAAVVRCAM